MAYFADLTACNYHRGAHDSAEWHCPLLAVGWLEHPNAFAQGESSPALVDAIRSLTEGFRRAFPAILFRGLHECSFCVRAGHADTRLTNSYVNLFIPGREVVFVAPARIDHYIEEHSYQPPADFVESLLVCPSPASAGYRQNIKRANYGTDSPLFHI